MLLRITLFGTLAQSVSDRLTVKNRSNKVKRKEILNLDSDVKFYHYNDDSNLG